MATSCGTPIPVAQIPFISTLTPIPGTQFLFTQATTLYSGPGNENFEKLAELPADTTVYLLGTYGDFVKVTGAIPGNPVEVTGFVRETYVPASIFNTLPVLTSNQVPWEPFYLYSCLPGKVDAQLNSLTFTNTGISDTETDALAVESPIRISVEKLAGGDIKILGIPEWGQYPAPYYVGMKKMNIYEAADGNFAIDFWDGSTEAVNHTINLGRSASQPFDLIFDRLNESSLVGTRLTILDENDQVVQTVDFTTMPGVNMPNGFLPDQKIYFGTGVAPGASFTVTGIKVETVPEGRWMDPDPGLGLYRLAEDQDLTIGTEFRINQMYQYKYCQAMRRNFNVAVVSEFNIPGFWQGSGVVDNDFTNDYDFNLVEPIVDYAHQYGWRVRASHLVWGVDMYIPDWIKSTNYPPETYKAILRNHIQVIMDHFRGRVQEWSLANEIPERVFCQQFIGDFWFEKIYGISQDYSENYSNYLDYLRMLFGWAREQDPIATLIFNAGPNSPPYDDCANITIQIMHDAALALNTPGQPKLIDVIGMEMHYDSPFTPKKDELINTMQRMVSGTGARINITEMDVNLLGLVASFPDQDERLEIQADVYKTVLDACLESGVCDNFSTWGISDGNSWATNTCDQGCLGDPDAAPLMFDDDFFPKPAYFAVRDALTGH